MDTFKKKLRNHGFMLKGVIFDWDGVLVNSMQVQHEYWQKLCSKHGKEYPYKSVDEVRRVFFEPFTEFYNQLGFDWGRDGQMLAQEFGEHMTNAQIPLFEGTSALLEEFSHLNLGIASANRSKVIHHRLEKEGLFQHFKAITTADDVSLHKPDPEPLLHCAGKLGLSTSDVVYVGDQTYDIIAAQRAGIRSVAVTWGWGFKEKLVEEKPDHIVHSMEELRNVLNTLK